MKSKKPSMVSSIVTIGKAPNVKKGRKTDNLSGLHRLQNRKTVIVPTLNGGKPLTAGSTLAQQIIPA